MPPVEFAPTAPRRARWLKGLLTVHWISSAICLLGLLLFSVTGLTLNHASQIEARPDTQRSARQLPPALLAQVQQHSQQRRSDRAPLPAVLNHWLADSLALSTAEERAEWRDDEVYLSLPRPGGDAWLRTATAAPPAARPSLYEANARLTAWQAEGASVRFSLQGHAPLEFSLRDAGACQVRADGRALSPVSSSRASGPAARAALSAQELARVRSVNERLGVVREQLARVLALADRQLASVVPQEPAPTYGAGHRPTARIYRAAG